MPRTHRVSRRRLLSTGATVVGGGAATLLGGQAVAAQQAPAVRREGGAPRTFKAWVKNGTRLEMQELRLRPLGPRQVIVRNQASQCCYSMVNDVLGDSNLNPARILGHGGVGIVEEVGPGVRRVQVGDRVVVANTPQCGDCYNCLHGRPEICEVKVLDLHPVADTATGVPIAQSTNYGGLAELMVPTDDFLVPVFTNVSSVELSMLGCVAGAGLAAATTFVPIEAGSNVAILGCGPVGLAAVQGARIMGAGQIIAIEPIAYRRELALKFGATTVLDPNVEGTKLVDTVRQLCKGVTDRIYAGGRDYTNPDPRHAWHLGPDFVIEAVGGTRFVPKAGAGPDPTGTLALRQAWEMTRSGGHLVTTGAGQTGEVSLPAGIFSTQGRVHHAGQLGGGKHVKRDIPRFITLIERGLFDAKALATATYPMSAVREAFQATADRTTVSSVITFE